MLTRLTVQNYALIADLEVRFEAGLNVLTGETGAGKSLLVDAIGLILGRRADTSVLLDPSRKCIVEAEAERLPSWVLDELRPAFEEAGVEVLPDEPLFIRREIAPGGKSRAFVNDTPVTLQLLKALAERAVDLHSQHEGARLTEPRVQLDVLDRFAGAVDAAREFGRRWQAYKYDLDTLEGLRRSEAEARRQLDYYQFQLNELTEAALEPGEDEQIEQQLTRLEHTEQIVGTLGRHINALADDEASVVALLRGLARELDRLAPLDARLAEPAQQLDALRQQLDTTADHLRRLAEDTELDPRRQQDLAARLDTYNRLKVKFAVRSVEELVALRDEFAQKVQAYSAAPERIAELEAALSQQRAELLRLGLQLERQRMAAAMAIEPQVAALLAEVGLVKASVQVRVSRLVAADGALEAEGDRLAPDLRGFNRVQFLVSTNPGVAPAPLQQVASGGEVARVMLALKAALAEQLGLATLIFDEIDTGISGEVAMKVGRVLQRLAGGRQLLVITHLPQIASRPASHFFLYKEQAQGRSATRLRLLDAEARVAEIAKILSGDPPPAPALQNARELMAAN